MTDLTNHAIIPIEHLIELESTAYNQTPATNGERLAQTAQNTILFASIAATVLGAAFGWSWVMDRLEKRRLERHMAQRQFDIDNPLPQ